VFIDSVEVTVSSGRGGAGCVSFRREKYVPQGGPDGGDGGDGGDLIFTVDNNTDTLSRYRGHHRFKAQNGEQGGSHNKTGRSGEDLILKVPAGTQVFDVASGEMLLDLTETGASALLLKGGRGGLGNARFKSSTNQHPVYAQKGLPGDERVVRLELKLIADVGLVGFPNVGKSTLISAVSAAQPQIADYEFTTITPSLGVVTVDQYRSFVMADIPGIISGASGGRGLGLQFLRHIERARVLLFMLDTAGQRSLNKQYDHLKNELGGYSTELSKRLFAIAFSRVDADPSGAAERVEKFLKKLDLHPVSPLLFGENRLYEYEADDFGNQPAFAMPISAVTGFNIAKLIFRLDRLISKVKSGENRC
jgi:GTP-binding protein